MSAVQWSSSRSTAVATDHIIHRVIQPCPDFLALVRMSIRTVAILVAGGSDLRQAGPVERIPLVQNLVLPSYTSASPVHKRSSSPWPPARTNGFSRTRISSGAPSSAWNSICLRRDWLSTSILLLLLLLLYFNLS